MNAPTRRPSGATVIALIALFVAIGGTAIAVHAHGTSNGKIVGYARVDADGQVISSQSKNVTNADVDLKETSSYCFKHLPFTFKGAQATIDFGGIGIGGASEQAEVSKGDPFHECGTTGVGAEVVTSDGDNASPQPFYVVFYK
jgi:hypothetical protein